MDTMPMPADVNANISGRVIAATVVGIVLPIMAVVGRIASRHIRASRYYLDDYLIICALLTKLGIDIAGCFLIEHGLGRHLVTLTPSDITIFLQVQYSGSVLYPLCVTLTKLSILYQYRRLFSGKNFHRVVDALIVILILWCIAVCFTGIFLCIPIRKAWDPLAKGTCIDLVGFYYGLQIPNVVTDAAILVLPLKEVADLRLPRDQKLGVALTCALWFLCLVFGIVRLVVMLGLEGKGMDFSWNLTDAAVWTSVEPTVAVVTACLPSLRVLYQSLISYCNRHKGDSHRLRNPSDASGTENSQTLVELSRGSRVINEGDCLQYEKENYGPPHHDDGNANGLHGPISPTHPSMARLSPVNHKPEYSTMEYSTEYPHSREDV